MSAAPGAGPPPSMTVTSAGRSRHARRRSSTCALPRSPYVPRRSWASTTMRTVDAVTLPSLTLGLADARSMLWLRGPGPHCGPAVQQALDLAEGGVRGQDVSLQLASRVERGGERRLDVVVDAGVAQAHRQVGGPLAGDDHAAAVQPLQRHVVQPRRIAPVRAVGVEGDH